MKTMDECPHCGAELAPKAIFCRECGADENTGWSDEGATAGLLPDEDLSEEDYENLKARGFDPEKPKFNPALAVLAFLVLLSLFVLPFLRR